MLFHFLTPAIAFAQSTTPTVKTVVYRISEYILNPVIKVGFVIALVWFMVGVLQYIRDRNAGHLWESSVFDKDSKMTTRGADKIVWGLVGLFIMVSAFGILRLIATVTGSGIKLPR